MLTGYVILRPQLDYNEGQQARIFLLRQKFEIEGTAPIILDGDTPVFLIRAGSGTYKNTFQLQTKEVCIGNRTIDIPVLGSAYRMPKELDAYADTLITLFQSFVDILPKAAAKKEYAKRVLKRYGFEGLEDQTTSIRVIGCSLLYQFGFGMSDFPTLWDTKKNATMPSELEAIAESVSIPFPFMP